MNPRSYMPAEEAFNTSSAKCVPNGTRHGAMHAADPETTVEQCEKWQKLWSGREGEHQYCENIRDTGKRLNYSRAPQSSRW